MTPAELERRLLELERRIPQGMMVSTTYGRAEVRPFQTGSPAILTSSFNSTTGYSWQKRILDLTIPGVGDATIPEEGNNAFTPDNNQDLQAGMTGWLEVDRQAGGYIFLPITPTTPNISYRTDCVSGINNRFISTDGGHNWNFDSFQGCCQCGSGSGSGSGGEPCCIGDITTPMCLTLSATGCASWLNGLQIDLCQASYLLGPCECTYSNELQEFGGADLPYPCRVFVNNPNNNHCVQVIATFFASYVGTAGYQLLGNIKLVDPCDGSYVILGLTQTSPPAIGGGPWAGLVTTATPNLSGPAADWGCDPTDWIGLVTYNMVGGSIASGGCAASSCAGSSCTGSSGGSASGGSSGGPSCTGYSGAISCTSGGSGACASQTYENIGTVNLFGSDEPAVTNCTCLGTIEFDVTWDSGTASYNGSFVSPCTGQSYAFNFTPSTCVAQIAQSGTAMTSGTTSASCVSGGGLTNVAGNMTVIDIPRNPCGFPLPGAAFIPFNIQLFTCGSSGGGSSGISGGASGA